MNRFLSSTLTLLALFLVAGTATAAPSAVTVPQLRAHEWQTGLRQFAVDHPGLTGDKVRALEDLAVIEDPSFFDQAAPREKGTFLAERMRELGRTLSTFEYQALVDSFPRSLVSWMTSSEILGPVVRRPTCDCAPGDCPFGQTCQPVLCTTDPLGSLSGVCR